ncbi:ABC-type nitrate/sulfonate/bicarbonate transport system, ATPase component [Clostridium cylindrosporum DSM 605]|uniref:ABC-type nitrate/sulfonate/bicarbonate transport system, ATPase component n=2 Tax=Clostridium cylindrosporum TaxID=1495 RepID=A0A0J8DBM6_CLOCY|nr:ABC-type nitrate/sulfonate/bicarbonate transport system, ATPase component [Clostridium cylindrosporum DSM 605]
MHLQMNSYQNKDQSFLISLRNINKSFDDKRILKDISINIAKGEFVSILGPSGCGKSTIFNIITGLEKQDSGDLLVSGDIGYMQQKDLLLPWKSIIENVVLPLDIKGKNKKESRQRAKSYMEMMGLEGYGEKYPYQLSGGMKQRASFLRTFLSTDEIMLLDEPFGALDSITKSKMQKWLLEMKNSLNTTILFITHDIEEAIFLSDRIYVMDSRPGIIKEEIYLDFFKEYKEKRLLSKELLNIKEDILRIF